MFFNRNKPSHLEILVTRIDNGDQAAEEELQRMFYNGLTSEQHNEARRKVYNRRIASNPNDSYALYMLAILEDDKTKAEQLFIRAAQLGNVEAMSTLGNRYSEYANDSSLGFGFGYDEEKSRYWYKKAADTGNPKSLVDYAVFCLDSFSQRDEKISYFKRAADLGYWKGMYYLAESYYRPPRRLPTQEEEEYAKHWYLKAAELCNSPNDTNTFSFIASSLGNIYGKKFIMKLVPPDYNREDAMEAIRWFTYALVFDNYQCKNDIIDIVDYCGIEYGDSDYQYLRRQIVSKFYPQ